MSETRDYIIRFKTEADLEAAKKALKIVGETGEEASKAAPKIDGAGKAVDKLDKGLRKTSPSVKKTGEDLGKTGDAAAKAAPKLDDVAAGVGKVGENASGAGAQSQKFNDGLKGLALTAADVDDRFKQIGKQLEKKQFEQAEQAARRLKSEIALMTGVTDEQRESFVRVTDSTERMARGAAQMEAANKKNAAGGRDAGMAMQQFSQGLEDAQYGLRGVQNNLPGLIQSLGGGPGLAGIISVLAVSIGVVVPMILKWTDALSGVESEAQKVAKTQAGMAKMAVDRAAAESRLAAQSQREMESFTQALQFQIRLREMELEIIDRKAAAAVRELDQTRAQAEAIKNLKLAELEAKGELTPDRRLAIENEFQGRAGAVDTAKLQLEQTTALEKAALAEDQINKVREESRLQIEAQNKELIESQKSLQLLQKNLIDFAATLKRNEDLPSGNGIAPLENGDVAAYLRQFLQDSTFNEARTKASTQIFGADKAVSELDSLRRNAEVFANVEKAVKETDVNIARLQGQIEETKNKAEEEVGKNQKLIQSFNEAAQQAESQLKSAGIQETANRVTAAVEQNKATNEQLITDLNTDLEKLLEKAKPEQLAESKKSIQDIKNILADGIITKDEIEPLRAGLADLKNVFATGTAEQLKLVNEMQNDFQSIIGILQVFKAQQGQIQQQIKRLEANGGL